MSMTPPRLQEPALSRLRLVTGRLARRVRQHAAVNEFMTPSRMSALMTIQRRGPLSLSDLARKERVGKSSITRLVAKLEAAGLIGRVPDADDGRSFLVDVTPAGLLLLVETNSRSDEYLDRQFAALSNDDRASLTAAIPVLERLLDMKL